MTESLSQNHSSRRPTGMAGFTIVWIGQLISVLASNMTHFAITIWVFQKTGSATTLGGLTTAFILPFLLLSPVAGVLVDRHSRKLMMMVSDLFAGVSTLGILALYLTGGLETWHFYAAAVINGIGNTFQWPAYSAAISTMVPKEQYGRANGMMSLVDSAPSVISPVLAGAVLPLVGLVGVLIFDVVTFVFAIGALMLVHIPPPVRTEEGREGEGSLFREAAYGFRYIFARRSLLGLLLFFLTLNFVIGLAFPVFAPLVLTRTGNDSISLGAVESAMAVGAVAGGLLVGLWGGFKRRMKSILIGEVVTGLGVLLFGFGRNLPYWMVVGALTGIVFPFVNGASQAIWQAKVAPDVQGRVFSARRMIAWLLDPLTPLLAGAIADYGTEPLMRSGSPLAYNLSRLVGSGLGSGMSLQFIAAGGMYMVIVIGLALFVPVVRNVEDLLPDHEQAV